MSSNNNGLCTTVQVAGNANLEASAFFVLKGNPTYIQDLACDTITANTIIGSSIDAQNELLLNNQTITATSTDLLLNGVPIGGGGGGGDVSGWALYNAISNVDMSGFKIAKMGTPTDASDATTKAYVDGIAAAITPSNWSAYPATQDVDFAGFQQSNVQLINAVAAADNPVFVYNPYALGGTTVASSNVLIAAGGDNRTDISASGVGIATQKNITRGIADAGAGETIGTFTTYGKDLADNDIPYASIRGVCVDPATAYPKGRMNFAARDGATNRVYMQIDASANCVSIQGNTGTTLDMAAHKIINLATPTDPSGAATKAYVDAIGGANNWANYAAVANVDLSGFRITKLGTPTDPSGAATKAYVDSVSSSWSRTPALQNVNFANFDISGTNTITAGSSGRITMPQGLLDLSGNAAAITLGSNVIYNRVVAAGGAPAGMSVNDPYTAGDATQTAYHFATVGTTQTSAIFTMCLKTKYTNLFGTQGTAASNTFVIASQGNNTDFEIRKGVGLVPANLTGGTLLAQFNRNGQVYLPLLSNATTANMLYFNTANGLTTYGAAPITGSNWSLYGARQNVDISGYSLTNVGGISNVSGSINMVGSDVNIQSTGIANVLNITSALGTAIVAGGAVDITAGGTTAINSTGNITIGSLGVTSIENFNLSNSVLYKVPATADLQLSNIALIRNASANIDISSSQVNVNSFQFGGSNLSAPGTTRLILDDVETINNDAAGGAIDITAATVRANAFQFAGAGGNIMTTNAGALQLNDIATLNQTSGSATIDSYATINANLSNSAGTGFKTTLTTNAGDAIGFWSDATTTSSASANAVGAYITGTTADNTTGTAVGLSVQTVLGGTNTGKTATGVEVWGTFTGDVKRGFWEHSATAGVKNTFVHQVGIGGDPDPSYLLDISGGTARIANTAANPTSLLLENVEGGASANVLRIYKNSTTPAANDAVANIQMGGNNSAAAYHTYASIQGAISRATAGSEAGEMRLRATVNSISTDFIHLDGSNNVVDINPNSNASMVFSMNDASGFNLIYADASNANVMFRNYPQQYIYDICGNYTLTLPNRFNTMRILAFGAGGGGGSGRKGISSCFGGGAGSGGNGVEEWYTSREVLSDASDSITLYITVGQGGAGGAAVTTAATNGNNGSNGGTTYVNLDAFGAGASKRLIPDTATSGGNGGSGGTSSAGSGGGSPTFSSDRNIGSAGRAGASSSITGQPVRNTTALLYNGSIYSQTGGSGAGAGIDAAGTTQYAGGIFVSPCGQKYNGLGANVNKGGAAGTAGGTPGGNGDIVSFDQLTTAAVRPLAGMCSLMGGGGASIGGAGGTGGGWTFGVPGSRGDGGGGGGATGNAGSVPSGAGGRGADGFVYITVW